MSNLDTSIKVQSDYSKKLNIEILFSVTISDEPQKIEDTGKISEKDITIIKEFIQVNNCMPLDYCNVVDIDIESIISRLKKT